ncbi:hypothetical protein [Pseudomonas sp. MF4836]|uniref:hypothetical protein n=2 Tax=Pseudomonas TaxID=286 RepID=UPI00128FE82B|nr:hypothetical protein [Pseudomonas sp. MF4836]
MLVEGQFWRVLKIFMLQTAHITHHLGNALSPPKHGVLISSPPPVTDAEFGPQPRVPALGPGNPLTLAPLLSTRCGTHSNQIITGYAGRMGPPRREEMGPIKRELEAARILARSPAAANLLNVRKQVCDDALNPPSATSSPDAPRTPKP